MNISPKSATTSGKRDEVLNPESANEMKSMWDKKAVRVPVENLKNKNKDIRNDCFREPVRAAGVCIPFLS